MMGLQGVVIVTIGLARCDEFFSELDVCFSPVNDLRAGFDLEQTRHREMCLTDPAGREHIGTPFKFDHEPGRVNFHAPGYGEHTDQLLAELGYDAAQITELRSASVV
jgi:crotonobetainyl-CoA:carnitine CoA-transferase CaiB-like acyl-CoA transferase